MSLLLSVGDIGARIESDTTPLRVRGAMERFVRDSLERVDCHVRVEVGSIPVDGEIVFDSRGIWKLRRHGDGLRIDLTSEAFGSQPYTQAILSTDLREATVFLREDRVPANEPVYPLAYPLDELIFTNLLADLGGVEIHSAGIVNDDGTGLIFAGQSGAGKTTTARLWHKMGFDRILSDDRIIVRDGEGGPRMFGTPWHGEAEYAIDASAPLRAILFLRQATVNEVKPVTPLEAMARLSTCSFYPLHDRGAIERTLGFLESLVGSVRCAEVSFKPDSTAIDTVRRALGIA